MKQKLFLIIVTMLLPLCYTNAQSEAAFKYLDDMFSYQGINKDNYDRYGSSKDQDIAFSAPNSALAGTWYLYRRGYSEWEQSMEYMVFQANGKVVHWRRDASDTDIWYGCVGTFTRHHQDVTIRITEGVKCLVKGKSTAGMSDREKYDYQQKINKSKDVQSGEVWVCRLKMINKNAMVLYVKSLNGWTCDVNYCMLSKAQHEAYQRDADKRAAEAAAEAELKAQEEARAQAQAQAEAEAQAKAKAEELARIEQLRQSLYNKNTDVKIVYKPQYGQMIFFSGSAFASNITKMYVNYKEVPVTNHYTFNKSEPLPESVEVIFKTNGISEIPKATFNGFDGSDGKGCITEMYFPSSVIKIGANNGSGCSFCSDIYIYSLKAPKGPGFVGGYIFQDETGDNKVGSNARSRRLHVPDTASRSYQSLGANLSWSVLIKDCGFSIVEFVQQLPQLREQKKTQKTI